MRVRVRVPAGFGLLLFGLLLVWWFHWIATCVGAPGQFEFSERRGIWYSGMSWGHTKAVVWAKQGETIVVRYDVRMDEPGRLTFRVAKARPFWELFRRRLLKTAYVRSSGGGSFSATAAETGLHVIEREKSSVWKGTARVWWSVE